MTMPGHHYGMAGYVSREHLRYNITAGENIMVTTALRTNGEEQNRQVGHCALDDDDRDAAAMGVGFDGRFYRYRTYRYDCCADAVAYAKLDQYKLQYQGKVIQSVPWEKAVGPTDDECRVMKALAISFDGKYYRFESYRYERCADAADYATLHSHGRGITDTL
jgi:hypothetical protein